MSTQTSSESHGVRAAIFGLSGLVVVAVAFVIYGLPSQPGGHTPTPLASINACLNAGATLCLLFGFAFVKRRNIPAHRTSMLTAFGFSSVFLVTYLLHHAQVGSVPFRGEGLIRLIYFAILIPHIVLAALVVPLALFTIYRGWTDRIEQHRRIARIALPVWLYVSVSGVLVYLMLYHL